jgi:hypothetical protein
MIKVVNGVKCVCRKDLTFMVGLFEEDAIKETFGAPMCELDCEDCPLKTIPKT